ncbi:MAG: disulfide bond formation protein B [Pseudomonadota bacterium]|nr:disulfide bond formation protein B [Pseudomonadota bacterium]
MTKYLAMPRAGFLILAASVGALIFAFILQYGFDVHPCVLCLWQRVPFGLTSALAVTALIWRPYRAHARVLIGLCAALFFVNAGLAFFHTGVEQHWWAGTSGCAVPPLHAASVEDLRARIMNAVLGHCDQISWTFLGLSMANWNIPFSLALGSFCLAAAVFRQPKFRS